MLHQCLQTPRDKHHSPATGPWASFWQPQLLEFALCSPAEATSRKCRKLRKFTVTLKSILKRKHMSCFLCEINSETEMSEGENESLNRSLQQGENGGKSRISKITTFLFFLLNTACSSTNKQSPIASSPRLFPGPLNPGRRKWCSLLCIFLLYFCGIWLSWWCLPHKCSLVQARGEAKPMKGTPRARRWAGWMPNSRSLFRGNQWEVVVALAAEGAVFIGGMVTVGTRDSQPLVTDRTPLS